LIAERRPRLRAIMASEVPRVDAADGARRQPFGEIRIGLTNAAGARDLNQSLAARAAAASRC
jgi:hypothetical protein